MLRNNNFEVLICLKSLDSDFFPKMIERVERFINPYKITIITKEEMIDRFKVAYQHINFLDENSICKGLSLESIREILQEYEARAGWYLQQFLKMAYAKLKVRELAKDLANRGGAARI